jgi:hypothetical protein
MSDPTLESFNQRFKDLAEQGIHPRPTNRFLEMLMAEETEKSLSVAPEDPDSGKGTPDALGA